MNIPPPRHAPLSLSLNRHTPEVTKEHARANLSADTFTLPVVVTPEDDAWKEELYQDMSSYSSEAAAQSQSQPHAERRASLARLALASGTGEDVAAFDTSTKRPRLHLEGKPLRALALLLAAILAGVWMYLGFDGKNVQEKIGSPSTSQPSISHGTSQDTGQKAGQETAQEIVVYISGAVATPGVYTLSAGARVNNCVEAAGGLSANAQSDLVNLAAALGDGEHIHIPAQGDDVSAVNTGDGAQATGGTTGKININTASAAQLEDLPGIGPALSQTIIAWREDNGRFASPEDLLEVSGIGQAKYAKLKDLVSVG